jgi:23S rRNA-/tRNA-specific pseudouridylate synthase
MENRIASKDVVKLISPAVKKIADEIGESIVELNGGRSTSAVFLVGGGAHTPKLKDFIAEKLNLPLNRIAIKDRHSVQDCVCRDNSLGSAGVTVLGIALVSIRRLGHGFVDVILNGNVVSLFNSHNHTVMDVMLQAGVDPGNLIGKNGQNIRFVLNDIKRVAFGTLASNAEVTINGLKKTMDDKVKEGDNIEIKYAVNGKKAAPKITDYVQKVYSISFFVNDIIENLEPLAYIDGNKVKIDSYINEGDNVNIAFPKTLGDYEKYFSDNDDEDNLIYYLNGEKLDKNYIINEGDRIYRVTENSPSKKEEPKTESENLKAAANEITVVANGKNVVLTGKRKYIFVDIFNHIEFDLTRVRGKLFLRLNGENAGYYDALSDGDVIEVGWE